MLHTLSDTKACRAYRVASATDTVKRRTRSVKNFQLQPVTRKLCYRKDDRAMRAI